MTKKLKTVVVYSSDSFGLDSVTEKAIQETYASVEAIADVIRDSFIETVMKEREHSSLSIANIPKELPEDHEVSYRLHISSDSYYDTSHCTLEATLKRLETDEEYEKRLASEEKRRIQRALKKECYRIAKEKAEAKQRAEDMAVLRRLIKRYGVPTDE